MNEKRSATPVGPIVVAVDGTDDGVRALKYGVQEANRLGRRLRLVHVAHQTVPMAPMLPLLSSETLLSIAQHVLADAEEHAGELGAEDVEAALADGPRVPAILDHCRDASRVVVGPRVSGLQRLMTGSTSSGLAARAACPVVCVPSTWDPDARAAGVVVGVDGSSGSVQVLSAGFEAARELDCGISVLHAWRPVGQYDAVIVEGTLVDRWRAEATEQLTELTENVRSEYPEVPVTLRAEYQSTKLALAEASRAAGLLVIGRHGGSVPLGLSLGSVARSMIHSAHCPVEIVPVRRHHRLPGSRLTQASVVAGSAPTY